MRSQLWIAATVLIFALSSCNLPASPTTGIPVSALTPTLDAPTLSVPTLTPVALETLAEFELPTVMPTPTSSVFLASPKDQPVNCRFGPATSYAIVGALIVGRQAEIIGRNEDSTWWYVRNPSDPSISCWLSAEFVETVGDVQSLPVASSPVIMVTGVTVSIDPPVLNIACD